MEANTNIRIIRAKDAYQIFGISRASFYKRISEGVYPPSISLGGERAVGWIDSEIQAVLKALVAGKKQNEIKNLVEELVAQRKLLI